MKINKEDLNLKVDLHMHSVDSDGSITIEDLLKEVIEKEIKVFSVTEHDTIQNIEKIFKFVEDKNIYYIPGVELSATFEERRIHILGYDFDYRNDKLKQFIMGNKILFRLVEDKGMDVIFPSPDEVIEVILTAGGVPILAHPGASFYDPDYKGLINRMLEKGIKGIECYHPQNNIEITEYCVKLCRKNDLYITGGSDYHGDCVPSRKLGMTNTTLADLNLKDLIR